MGKKKQNSLEYAMLSDVGQHREHNEDSLLIEEPLFVVADGLGGHAAGEVASALAIETLKKSRLVNLDASALRHAIQKANSEIIRAALEGRGREGMGTTMTAAIIKDGYALFAQVGDSRGYLLRSGALKQITRDHSLVEELMAGGFISQEEARTHPNRSVITRALGSESNVQPDIYELRLHKNDRILLCSDGLSTMIDDEGIEAVLQFADDAQDAANTLVLAANEAGGYDNISVIVIDVKSVSFKIASRSASNTASHAAINGGSRGASNAAGGAPTAALAPTAPLPPTAALAPTAALPPSASSRKPSTTSSSADSRKSLLGLFKRRKDQGR